MTLLHCSLNSLGIQSFIVVIYTVMSRFVILILILIRNLVIVVQVDLSIM